ncbi:MAG: ATP synthase F1 subunit delta [Deferribacteraceae bacterium]|nr:ATP synthase F1 subunit delta [Deferribacteraceae bacterium]
MKNIAVARRYAGALYEEALERKDVDAVFADIAQFAGFMSDSTEFATFVSSPTISINEKLNVIDTLDKSGKLNKLVTAFLTVLTSSRRLPMLPEIVEAFNECIMNARNEIKVDVIYAIEANDDIRKSLKEYLAKLTGKTIVLSESVDPKLLGGMRVFVGSELYDTSIKGKLEAMEIAAAKDKLDTINSTLHQ